jgi:hypothetical protein
MAEPFLVWAFYSRRKEGGGRGGRREEEEKEGGRKKEGEEEKKCEGSDSTSRAGQHYDVFATSRRQSSFSAGNPFILHYVMAALPEVWGVHPQHSKAIEEATFFPTWAASGEGEALSSALEWAIRSRCRRSAEGRYLHVRPLPGLVSHRDCFLMKREIVGLSIAKV